MTWTALITGILLAAFMVALLIGGVISRAELEEAKLAALESHRFHFEDGPAPPARMVHYAQDLSEIEITTDVTYEQVTRWLPLDVVADIEHALDRHSGGTS